MDTRQPRQQGVSELRGGPECKAGGRHAKGWEIRSGAGFQPAGRRSRRRAQTPADGVISVLGNLSSQQCGGWIGGGPDGKQGDQLAGKERMRGSARAVELGIERGA